MSASKGSDLLPHMLPIGKRGILQFVRRVPEDVVRTAALTTEFEGRRVWKRSLGSSDPRVAKAAYARVLDDFERRLQRARLAQPIGASPISGRAARLRQPDAHDLKWIRDAAYQRAIDKYQRSQAAAFRSWDQFDLQERYEDDRFRDGEAWRAHIAPLAEVDKVEIDEWVLALAEEGGLHADDETDATGLMRMAVVNGRRAAHAALQNSDLSSPLFDPERLARKERGAKRRIDLSDVLAEYLAARKREPRWVDKLRVGVAEFQEFLGEPSPIDQIQRSDVQAYVEALERSPARRKQLFPGLSLLQATAENERRTRPYPTLHPTTIKETKLATLSTLFNFAVDSRGYLSASPMQRIKVSKVAHEDRSRQPFDDLHLARLFRHPIWTGCSDPKRPYKPGDKLVDDHRFWAPLLLAYTGARPGELAAVRLSELVIDGGTPHLKIRWNEDGRLKTKNARREVPILDAVMELGFAAYVHRLRQANEERLFPRWAKGGTVKEYSQAPWARAFNRTVVGSVFGEDEGSRYSIYSFRKNFKGLLIDNDISLQIQHALMGHEPGEVERAYAGRISIERTYPRVHHLRYPSLHLSRGEDGRLSVGG